MQNQLTLAELQRASTERGVAWRNGQPSLSLEFAVIELGGEAGELLDATKKYLRQMYGMKGAGPLSDVLDELADVVICCSLLANKLEIDLADAVARKFNATSMKHGFPQRLPVLEPAVPAQPYEEVIEHPACLPGCAGSAGRPWIERRSSDYLDDPSRGFSAP